MVKAVLLDFDGTLVYKDLIDIVCGIVGKEKESESLNRDFHAGRLKGLTGLITRINFLSGVTLAQIQKKLDEDAYLINGAKELTDFLRQKGIVTIIHSGNIVPILLHYQKLLGVDCIVGTQPKMDGDTILGISEEDIPGNNFKVAGVSALLKKLSVRPADTVAIGDSPADKAMFEYAGKSIAINPKEGIEKYADFVIHDDLTEAIKIIQELNVPDL